MEFVALSDTVLQALTLDDPQLRRVFQGVYPAPKLTRSPTKNRPRGAHCQHRSSGGTRKTLVGAVDRTNKCEIFVSYGLPLHVYKDPDLHQW